MESQRGTEIKVGLFVIVALCVGGVLVFLIGSATQMFDKQVNLYTSFNSVSGLKVGSQVQLSGLKIGVVDQVWVGVPKSLDIKLPPSVLKAAAKRPRIIVRMKVVEKMLKYISSKDSIATIKGKGLLGDSLVEISMSTEGKQVEPQGYVKGTTPKSLNDFIAEGGVIIASLKRSLKSVETILSQYKDPTLSNNLKGIVGSVANVLKRVDQGPGLVHDVFYSRRLTNNLNGAVAQIRGLAGGLDRTVKQVDNILVRARRRGTLVHTLVLSRKSGKLVENVNRTISAARVAVAGLARILQAPQRKGTLLYKILYSRETARLATNIVKATDHLRTIMRDIRAGKGTLGAIINDPTAFEDFKTILGQVKRSRIFKTLIRFIIKRDDNSKGGRLNEVKLRR